MAKKYSLQAKVRDGKASLIRRSGGVPAVLYGHGIEAMSLELNAKQFNKIYSEAGETSIIEIEVEGEKTHPILFREVQFHPLTSVVTHIDLYQVRMDEEITANVPLQFVGESAAVKDMAGVLVRNMDEVEVSAFPQNLPHSLEVDISALTDFEKAITVSDLKIPEGVTLLGHEPEDVVALVQEPRSQEELDQLSEVVTEDVESVEGVKDKPDEGEAEGEGDANTQQDEAKE